MRLDDKCIYQESGACFADATKSCRCEYQIGMREDDCPSFKSESTAQKETEVKTKADAEARIAASRQMVSARIQAMIAAARPQIDKLREMLEEANKKDDKEGAAICLRTLAEINMSATDHAMTFARERIVDELLTSSKEKTGA
jgi:Pyruvate/2-oxoacid:ferredoxin oxidoreductase gamma subunit